MQQVPPDFIQICRKLYAMVPPQTDFVFSTDMYQECSVKSMERNRRGSGDQIILKGDSTKRPADWKVFLANEKNKVQFIKLLLDAWSKDSFAEKHKGRNVILICEGKAFKLTSVDGKKTDRQELHSLSSTQEETDSRVILYSKYGQDQGYKYIRVKSPDTDIFFILLNFALQLDGVTVLFDTGKGNKKRLIDISDLARGLTQLFCSALLSLHAYTGCDSTSAFKGKGKVKALKVLQQKPAFVHALAQLGDTWDVQEQVIDDLESFTCCVYGRSRFSKVDDLRHHLLKEKCGEDVISASQNVDLATLPPSRRSLKQHIRRSNYQVAIWKHGDQPMPHIPNPTEGHGWVINNGSLEPLWTEEEEELTLPQTVIDDLVNDFPGSDDEEEDDRECFLQNGLDDSLDSSSEDSDDQDEKL